MTKTKFNSQKLEIYTTETNVNKAVKEIKNIMGTLAF
jgi:hypothetical protein